MRLWSLHPKYLDPKGLVALWREGLLALAVLQGKTKGYTHHPQLNRFKVQPDPVDSLKQYLAIVHAESEQRGYHFSHSKILPLKKNTSQKKIMVTKGQLSFEHEHLYKKLLTRAPNLASLLPSENLEPHPLFKVIPGGKEEWEKA